MRFTVEYFRSQVIELRHLLGTRKFWDDPRAAEKATRTIGFVYLNTDNLTEFDASLFTATLHEITAREAILWLVYPQKQDV
jgi:hypothetical protein